MRTRAFSFIILVTLLNISQCRQYQSLESVTQKWNSSEATVRYQMQEINQLKVEIQKQKNELVRANIQIDYLLQARDTYSNERIRRLQNKLITEEDGRLSLREEALQTVCFRPRADSNTTDILKRFPAMTADQFIFINTNCAKATSNRDPYILLCDGTQQSYPINSQCQCPTLDQLHFSAKIEHANTNIQLELSNGKMICTNYSQNNVEAVTRLLIPQEQTLNKFDTYRTTLLLLCRFYSRDNLIDLVRKLIKNNPIELTEDTVDGSSALLVLCGFSTSDDIVQVADLLIENGVSVNGKGKYGYNALMALLEYSTSDKIDQVAELLINKGLNLEEVDQSGKNALTVLCAYSKSSKILPVVELLINNGINSHQKDKNGKSAVDYMYERSFDEVPDKWHILEYISPEM